MWRQGAHGPLRHRNFRLLLGCDVTSLLGSTMSSVAVPFAVLRLGGSATDVGDVAAAGLVPTVVFLLFGGVVADRLPRQRVMTVANLVEALTQATFAVLVITGHARVWEMAALAAAGGCAMGFFYPAAQGLLPQTVDADDLAAANATARLGLSGASIAGGALGGLVVAAVGPGWGLGADSASFVVAALLRLGMRIDGLPPTHSPGVLHELREGWRAFISRTWLWVIVVQFGFVNAASAGAYMVLGPVVAAHRLGGAGSWGLVLAARSAGSLLGALLTFRWRPRRLLVAASLAVPGFALVPLGLAVPLPVAAIAALALVGGAGGPVFMVNWSLALQEQIPAGMLSRVSAYDALGSFALSPLGTILAGPIALALGTATTLAGGGVFIVGSSLAVLCVGDVRRLVRRPPIAPGLSPDLGLSPDPGRARAPGRSPDPAAPGSNVSGGPADDPTHSDVT